MSDDLVKRLRKTAVHYAGYAIGHDATEAADRIESFVAEVRRCHARLEIDHVWQMEEGGKVRVHVPPEERGSIPDGIECRNETIKLLDQNIATLRANAVTDRQALASALERLADIHTTAILYIGGEADTSHVAATGLIERIATIAATHPDEKP